ncbi:MAG: hypothetical protein PVG07_15870, partial [Acidobacteriota bacterium]
MTRLPIRRPRRVRLRQSIVGTTIVVMTLASPRAVQAERTEETAPFRGEERVTAIDLMVELPRPHVLRPFDGPPDARELRVELGS